MRVILMLLLALPAPLSATPNSPAAQQVGKATPGMTVIGPKGQRVGTVKGIKGDELLIATDKHETWIPRSSFTEHSGKLHFALTSAQLNAEIEKSIAAEASVIAGATVNGLAGKPIGKIDSINADSVTIVLSSGSRLQVPKVGVRGNPDGTVTLGLTAEQVAEKVTR